VSTVLSDLQGHPIIAHRGASGSAPENTLRAFALAIELGAEAIELDLRLSADGVPVVCHDPTLDRTTDRTGPVGSLTSGALGQVDAGAKFQQGDGSFPFRGSGIGIPTLATVLEHFPTVPLLIELKEVEVAIPARRVLEEHGARDRVAVASFIETATDAFDRSSWQVGPGRRGIAEHAVRAFLGLPGRRSGLSCFAVPDQYKGLLPVPTKRFVAAAHRLGCPVHVWTVNEPALAKRLWDQGANGMITNFPAELLEARRARFGR